MTENGTPELTEAEAISVLVCGALNQREQARDQARRFAARATEELAAAETHLEAMVAIITGLGGATFAHDSAALDQAKAFLTRDRTPTDADQ